MDSKIKYQQKTHYLYFKKSYYIQILKRNKQKLLEIPAKKKKRCGICWADHATGHQTELNPNLNQTKPKN